MKGGFFLDVVVRKGSSILELFASENQSLLLWRDAFFVLDLGLDIGDGIIWLHIEGNRLSREGLDENLHGTTAETEDKMKGGFFLDVVVRKGSSILELFAGENQSLLLWRDAFF